MMKHFFWGAIVLLMGVLAAYVALVLAGHSAEAQMLGQGAIGVVGGILFIVFWYVFLG